MARLAYIDCIRSSANILRCFVHAAVPYMVTVSSMWPVDETGSMAFDFPVFIVHLFVMELFFVVAGYMFAMQWQRMSFSQFLNNRFRRIGIPFIFGLVVLMPVVLMLFSLGRYKSYEWTTYGAVRQAFAEGIDLGMHNFFPTGHLWFLYYLLLFYALAIVLYRIGLFGFLRRVKLTHYILAACCISFFSMFFIEKWIIENPLTLLPEFTSFTHFFLFFVLGILIFHSEPLPTGLSGRGGQLVLIGIITGLICAGCQLYFDDLDNPYYDLLKVLARGSYAASAYLLTVGCWFFFRARVKQVGPVTKFMADAAYWIYLVNMPIVMILQLLLLPVEMSIYLKFLLVFSIALVLSVASYAVKKAVFSGFMLRR